MRQAFRKTLPVLLVLTLLLLVMPGLTGHTASAATLISQANFNGIDYPVAGGKPDYDANISYGDSMFKFWTSSTYKNGIGWKDETTGNMMKTTDTFIEGHKYTVIVQLEAKSGYVFSTNGSTVQTKGYINGYKATGSTYYTSTRAAFSYNMGTAEKTLISKVTISGITAPKAGNKPVYAATVSGSGFTKVSTSGWYTNGVGWKDVTTGNMMSASDTFVAGHTYRVIVSLRPNTGYTFKKDEGGFTACTDVTINGYTVSESERTYWINGDVGFYHDFTPEGVVSKVIIVDINEPAIGKTPDYTYSYWFSTQVTSDTISYGNWKSGVIWFDMTAGGSSIAPTDKFIEGHIYKVRVSLYTKTGYSFCDSAGNVATKGTINDNEAATYKYSKTNVGFEYTFPALSKTVKTAAVTGIDAPKAGSTPDYTATVTATGAKLENYTSGTTWKNGILWYNMTDDFTMTTADKFENGKVYMVIVSLVSDEGYTFEDGAGSVVTTGTLNGQTAKTERYSPSKIGVKYEFPALESTISSVTITGVDAPAIGKTPDYDVTMSGTGCKKEDYNTTYWKNGVYWYDLTADEALKPTDTFVAGHQYKVTVSIISDAGYTFLNADGTVATTGKVNGNAAETYKYSNTNIGVLYIFPALASPAAGVAITGIDAPAAGNKPDYTASGSGASYYVESDYTSSPMWLNGIEWYDLTASSWVNSSTDTFIAGHQYKVIVSVKANSGYFFDSSSTATINGKAAEIFQIWSSDNAGFQYTFDALPAPTALIESVTVTGVTEPKAGEKPDYDVTVSGTGFTLEDYNSSTWVHGVIWRDVDLDSDMKPEDTFQAGHQYRIGLSLVPAEGYTFKNDSGAVVTPGTINGNTVTQTFPYSDGTVAYRYTFPKVEGTEVPATLIESVVITGVTAPVTGASPDYDVTAAGPGYGVENYNSSAWKNGVFWYDETASADVYPDDTFMEGHVYTVSVSIEPEAGYTFWNGSGDIVATGAIDGTPVTSVEDYADGTVGFKLTFPAASAGKIISSINVTATAPVKGAKPDYTVTLTGEGVSLKDENWNDTLLGSCVHGVMWNNRSQVPSCMFTNSTFDANQRYMITVRLVPEAGYVFPTDSEALAAVVTFNGQPATEAWPDGKFSFEFPMLGEGSTIVTTAAITNVAEPVANMTADYDVMLNAVGCKLEVGEGEIWVNGISWRDLTEDRPLKRTETVKYAHEYCMYIGLDAEGGYTFSSDMTLTVNGKPAKLESLTSWKAEFSCTFTAHLFWPDTTGFAWYEGGLFLVSGGDVVTTANGLWQDPNHPETWYFCANGQAQLYYTGLAEYGGQWFYLESGVCDTNRVGVVSYDGGLFVVAAGRLLQEYTGLIQDPNTGLWYFVVSGQVQAAYTGLVQYDGAWFYVISGRLATEYTGPVDYDGSTFYVENGMVK